MSDSIAKARKLVAEEREATELALRAMRERHEQEASGLTARVEQLRATEDTLASLNGAKAPVSSPPDKTRGRSRSTPATASTPPEETPAPPLRRSPQRDRVLAFIQAHPGCSGNEIAEGLGIGKSTVSQCAQGLVRQGRGQIRVEKNGKAKAYFANEAEALPADESGAKSEQERKVVECLIEADGPLPASEISLRTGIRSDHVPSMCQALAHRRVISRVPPKRDGLPARFQPISHPRTMSDRAKVE